MASIDTGTIQSKSEDFPEISGIDYIELYVGNSRQAAYFYSTAFGFTPIAYAGQETGLRDRMSYVLVQGKARLVLTAPLTQQSDVAQHVYVHGDGIKDIAFLVNDTAFAFDQAMKRGAQSIIEPTVLEDQHGKVIKATVSTFGDTVHTFVQRKDYFGVFLPSYHPLHDIRANTTIGLAEVDHFGVSVVAGTLDEWVEYYRHTFGFQQVHQENVITANSAMHSRVVQDRTGIVKLPIQEPAPSKRKSQIEEYLAAYNGPGVQHLALSTHNIISTVRRLRECGIEFLYTPDTYYETVGDRVGAIEEDIDALRQQHILVDRDEWGYLLQIFSKPMQSRPTFFLELIQRRGAHGFGSGNIKALFEAVERDQALRGTL